MNHGVESSAPHHRCRTPTASAWAHPSSRHLGRPSGSSEDGRVLSDDSRGGRPRPGLTSEKSGICATCFPRHWLHAGRSQLKGRDQHSSRSHTISLFLSIFLFSILSLLLRWLPAEGSDRSPHLLIPRVRSSSPYRASASSFGRVEQVASAFISLAFSLRFIPLLARERS